jgi:major membrane immunogen (membrane-anchored lipoprotein)
MKNLKIPGFGISLLIIILTSSVCRAQDQNSPEKIKMTAIHLYKDGDFEGKSCAKYTGEPYWGIVRIKIENGIYKNVSFMIRDSNLHETFTKKYAVHFKDNPVYIKQCKKDSKGVKAYPKKLVKKQDIDKVDAMSGATWSCNIFKASVDEALKKAYNEFEPSPSH